MTPDNKGLPGGFSGNSVWGSAPSVDVRRNVVYIATGNNYGAECSSAHSCAVDSASLNDPLGHRVHSSHTPHVSALPPSEIPDTLENCLNAVGNITTTNVAQALECERLYGQGNYHNR
jgi:hypothetical protein